MSEEICSKCCGLTGKAGRGEDSLYYGDLGPFCGECWEGYNYNELLERDYGIEELKEQNELLKSSWLIGGERDRQEEQNKILREALRTLKALIPDIEAVNRTDGQQIGHGRYLDAVKAIRRAEETLAKVKPEIEGK